MHTTSEATSSRDMFIEVLSYVLKTRVAFGAGPCPFSMIMWKRSSEKEKEKELTEIAKAVIGIPVAPLCGKRHDSPREIFVRFQVIGDIR